MRSKSRKTTINFIGYVSNPELIQGTNVGYSEEELKGTSTEELRTMFKSIYLYFKIHTRQKTRNAQFKKLFFRIKAELNRRKKFKPTSFLNKKRNSPIFSVPLFFNDIETKGNFTMEYIKEEENTNDNSYAQSEATVSDTESDFINFVEHYNSCDYELDEEELNSTYRAKSDISIKEFVGCFEIKN